MKRFHASILEKKENSSAQEWRLKRKRETSRLYFRGKEKFLCARRSIGAKTNDNEVLYYKVQSLNYKVYYVRLPLFEEDYKMKSFDELKEVVRKLRAPDGCPWDKEQTHSSLKPGCIEEAAEVLCGINVYERTGNPENLKEELGDLLLQVVMQAQIAEEEGIFTMDDVAKGITEKLIRRHPHVFGDVEVADSKEVLKNWDEIKAKEKEGKEDPNLYLPEAFDEAENLINAARKRKGFS